MAHDRTVAASATMAAAPPVYDDSVVKMFFTATVVWGLVGMLVGVIIALQLAWHGANLAPYFTFGRLRPLHTNAVIFAFAGNVVLHRDLLLDAAAPQDADVQRRPLQDPLLGVAGHHRGGRDHPSAGIHPVEGIRRVDLADRHRDHDRLGCVCDQLLRHARSAPGQAHVRGHLVLHVVRVDDRGAPHLQQSRDPRDADPLLPDLCRSDRRAGPVVVRPQRRGLLPDHALPRPDVLLPAAGGRTTGLQLPTLDHPLLGPGLPLHLGRTPPPSLLGAPRLGADDGNGVQHHAARAVMGRNVERIAHPQGGVEHAPIRSHPDVHGRGRELLRHEYLRGPDDVDPGGEWSRPLYQLGHRPRALRGPGLGRHDLVRHALLARSEALQSSSAVSAVGLPPLLVGHDRHRVVHGLAVGGGTHGGTSVAGHQRGRPAGQPHLCRHHGPARAVHVAAPDRRHLVSRRGRHDGDQLLADDPWTREPGGRRGPRRVREKSHG